MAWETVPPSAIKIATPNSQWAKAPSYLETVFNRSADMASSVVKSPALRQTATAMSALPPTNYVSLALKGIGFVALAGLAGTALTGAIKAGLPAVASPNGVSPPSSNPAPNSPSGGVNFPEIAKGKTTASVDKANTASTPVSSGLSLLEILQISGENTFQILSAQTQIQAEQFGFFNEQFGAHLLYMDLHVSYMEQIAQSLSILTSASIDTTNVLSDMSAHTVKTPAPKDYSSELGLIGSALASSAGSLDALNTTMQPVSDNAVVSKERQIFKQTPQTFYDLEGNPILTSSPDQIRAGTDANQAKFHSDTNNDSYDDIDLPLLDLLPIIPFHGVSSSFDKSVDISLNPFSHKNI